MIHRHEVQTAQWSETSIIRTDGLEEFREKPEFGNRHAIFQPNLNWGEIHYDEHNALDFPNGTLDHLAKYTEEKTGIPEKWAKGGLILGGVLAGIFLLKGLGGK
ncbi:hypothetical protein [Nitrosopumilus sp.]|uniref:hypothetical protein n=1 Tax=Nitrosopumilus sp. TaxID=2024843 RepID=UPI0034A0A661